jgi:hypothetical protein
MTEGQNPYAPPAADIAPPPPDRSFAAELRGDTRGRRIAGILLLANAALVGFAALFVPQAGARGISAVIDIAVAVALLRGYGSAANIALIRIAIAVVFALVAGVGGNWETFMAAVPLALAFSLLLIGNPGKARIIVACVVFGLYYLLSVAGVVMLLHDKG